MLIPFLSLLGQESGALIEGQATNSLTGEAVRKCKITLRRLDAKAESTSYATTDAEGRFAFDNLPPGRFRLSAEKTGFAPQEFGARVYGRPGTVLALDRGMQLKGLALRITPQGAVSGKVTDEDGDPIAGAAVQLLRTSYIEGRPQLTATGFTQTNDLGEYRIFGVNPGRYYLSASTARSFDKKDDNFAPTYFPGTIDPAVAGRLEIIAGLQLRSIDLTLRKTPVLNVKGKFSGPGHEQSTRSGTMQLYPRGLIGLAALMRNFTTIRGTAGVFEFPNVLPGSYVLVADQAEDKDKHYFARIPVEVGNSSIDDLHVTLSEGVEIQGRIRMEGQADVSLAGAMVFLRPRDVQTGANVNTRIKPDGTFTLASVPPGWHRVNLVTLPPALYLKSIRYGQDDALLNGFNATGPNQLEIVLSSKGGAVDGQTTAGARVGLIPRSGLPEYYKVTTADGDGRFAFRGVAPGDYVLLASEEIDAGRFSDPELLTQFESSGEAVSIKEGSRETKQLKTISPDPR